jgi:hypothetical protein
VTSDRLIKAVIVVLVLVAAAYAARYGVGMTLAVGVVGLGVAYRHAVFAIPAAVGMATLGPVI